MFKVKSARGADYNVTRRHFTCQIEGSRGVGVCFPVAREGSPQNWFPAAVNGIGPVNTS